MEYWVYRSYTAKVEQTPTGYSGRVPGWDRDIVTFAGKTRHLAFAAFSRAIDNLKPDNTSRKEP